MHDLAILVPSRGRPHNAQRLVDACRDTGGTDYRIYFALDSDDPELDRYQLAGTRRAEVVVGERQTLAGWTNWLWRQQRHSARYFASLGDDHVPLTPGWDAQLCAAIEAGGGGFAYCNNGHQIKGVRNLPEMCVMSAAIPAALGWVCEPSLAHYFVDNVWKDLGEGANCLHYLHDVTVEHRHWSFNVVAPDDTYWDNQGKGANDRTEYEVWRADRMGWDVAKVKKAVSI